MELTIESREAFIRTAEDLKNRFKDLLPEIDEMEFKYPDNISSAKCAARDSLVRAKREGCIDEKTMNIMNAKVSELASVKEPKELGENMANLMVIERSGKQMIANRELDQVKNAAKFEVLAKSIEFEKLSKQKESNKLESELLKKRAELARATEKYNRTISGTGINAQITHEGSEMGHTERSLI